MSGLAYLYCILPGEAAVDLAGIPSMEPEQPLQLVRADTLQAAWSVVGDDFAEASLNERVRDLDWLSPRAVRHHEVIDALYGRCKPLLPLSFGVIFRSVDSLAARLMSQQTDLLARLEWLRGTDEWNLKMARDQAVFNRELRQVSPELRQLESEREAKSPGTRFLLEKKIHNMEAREAQGVAARVRADVHETLQAHAVEAHRDQLTPSAANEAVRLDLRGAYLVEEQAVGDFKRALDDLAGKYGGLGYSFELTGPWPAFTFARSVQEALA